MQKNAETPRSPSLEKGRCKRRNPLGKRKKPVHLSAVTSGVTTPKPFLLLVEGAIRPSLDDTLANLSTSSSHLFYQQRTTKNTKLWTRQNPN